LFPLLAILVIVVMLPLFKWRNSADDPGSADQVAKDVCQQEIMHPYIPEYPNDSFVCTDSLGAAPCQYASLHGFRSGGLKGDGSSFVVVTLVPKGNDSRPEVQVTIVHREGSLLRSFFGGPRFNDVRATARCDYQ
jgi:hypothetical protein